jgi:hypothetical protein
MSSFTPSYDSTSKGGKYNFISYANSLIIIKKVTKYDQLEVAEIFQADKQNQCSEIFLWFEAV